MCETYYFSLACSSRWQPNYHFRRYTDIQIENCTQERGSFLSGWWFMGCLCREIFSSLFLFSPGSVFPLSVALLVIYITSVTGKRRENEERRERRWWDLSPDWKRFFFRLQSSREKLLLPQNVCGSSNSWKLKVLVIYGLFLAYSTLNTSKFYITGPRQYKSYDTNIF